MTMNSSVVGFMAPVVHHFRPEMTQSSPSARMDVVMFVASEDATAGSVMQNADRIRASRRGASHRSRCASVPNCARSSMLPVSGAAQFIATGASFQLRPESSARGAYWRFVRPAPCAPGRKRFHRPRACRRLKLAYDSRKRPVVRSA